MEGQTTYWMAEVVSKQQVKNVKAIEMAMWLQKRCNGLQKLGRVVCPMPVRFRFEIPAAADPALINAYPKARSIAKMRQA